MLVEILPSGMNGKEDTSERAHLEWGCDGSLFNRSMGKEEGGRLLSSSRFSPETWLMKVVSVRQVKDTG